MAEGQADVFICGAGPVGLVLAYHLTRMGISVTIIDTANKASPEFPMYGRASTLLPRTLELLDQLDLYDDLAQEAVIGAETFPYADGVPLHARGWGNKSQISGTFFSQHMNLRLKFSEDIFREKLSDLGVRVLAPVRLVGLELDESRADDYKVSIACTSAQGDTLRFTSKFIVGADGGSSAVRKLAQIPFVGEHKNRHWVRIDGKVRTNLPESRIGSGVFDSRTHGQVLLVTLDHGATRIGYALSGEMFEKYGIHMTQEQAAHEAKLSVAPFDLEFEQVDWHTVYGVQQRVADRMVSQDRIVLAGDAAHTHSSGTAQGMNTGIHDVVSLGWRLAGVIKGWYGQPILYNYSDERHAVALQLINNDKIISSLVSGDKPEEMKHRPETANQLLTEFNRDNISFTLGLGISYPPNMLNDAQHALVLASICPGHRLDDVLLQKPGLQKQHVRLYELTRYDGRFKVLVFAGEPSLTRTSLDELRSQVDKQARRVEHAVEFLTIVKGNGRAFDEYMGTRKFGKAYWDADSTGHENIGVAPCLGALVVLRPDGIVGTCAALGDFEKVVMPYLERLIRPQARQKAAPAHADVGELVNAFENNLVHSRRNAAMLAS